MTFGFGMGFPRASSAAGGPSLNLQFAGATTLDPSITFTRASSGSYYDSTGILRLADTNEPRLDYNPSTLQPQGLLIEESRTNLLTYSSEFDNAIWTKLRASIVVNVVTAPDGTSDADQLLDTNVAGTHVTIQTISKAASALSYSATVYLKKNALDKGELRVSDQAGNGVRCTFNLTSGSVGAAAAFGTGFTVGASQITTIGDGWYRVVLTGTSNAAVTLGHELYTADASGNLSYTGTGTGFYIWGAQLEVGAFATSYIPTVAAEATRAAEFAVITTLTPWYNATEGTLMSVAVPYSPVTAVNQVFVSLNDATATTRTQIVRNALTSYINGAVVGGGVVFYNALGNIVWDIATVGRAALAYKTSDNKLAFNGVLNTVATSTAGVPVITQLTIGGRYDGGVPFNGAISSVTYYPRRLSDTELQSITA